MNWRIVAIPVTLIPIILIAIQFDIKPEDILECASTEALTKYDERQKAEQISSKAKELRPVCQSP